MTLRKLSTILAAAGLVFSLSTGDALAKKDKGGDASADAPAEIQDTGLPSFDKVFGQVKDIHATLAESQKTLDEANGKLKDSLGVTENTTLSQTIGKLKAEAMGNLTLTMDGGKPMIATTSDTADNIKAAVAALNDSMDGIVEGTKKLQELVPKTQELVAATKELPPKVPDEAKSAGLNPMEIPGLTKKVNNNVKATGQTKDRTELLIAEYTAVMTAVQGLAG